MGRDSRDRHAFLLGVSSSGSGSAIAVKNWSAGCCADYLVMGRYDAVVISEGPDDETAAKLALVTGMHGNVHTETLRAFPEAEFRRIVAALP